MSWLTLTATDFPDITDLSTLSLSLSFDCIKELIFFVLHHVFHSYFYFLLTVCLKRFSRSACICLFLYFYKKILLLWRSEIIHKPWWCWSQFLDLILSWTLMYCHYIFLYILISILMPAKKYFIICMKITRCCYLPF